jgi:6-phosphofructokinase 1
MTKTHSIGILASGGDTPGLNAAIRGVGKAAIGRYGMNVIGFLNGFRGLMEDRTIDLNGSALSGILTLGGTILGTSRDKPNKMPVGGKLMDMTDHMVDIYKKHHLDALVCLGGGGTAKNAYRLSKKGINVINLPKTIDNDVWGTDISFGFDTALGIATEAIDRLHSTAHSHHRIIVVEIMGHNAGWLALGAGMAGGADVILLPEIPYDTQVIADTILRRLRRGSPFSIVAVSEGAAPKELAAEIADNRAKLEKLEAATKKNKAAIEQVEARLGELEKQRLGHSLPLAAALEQRTGLESRVTILGHIQRGGTPSAADRLLASRLGTACAEYIHQGKFGVLVAARGDGTEAVPLADIVGKRKTVPLDHPWIKSARDLGIGLGDVA